MESVFASSETSIIEQAFLTRVLGFKVWRRAVVEGRIPFDAMKKIDYWPLACGMARGNLEGIRTDFGAIKFSFHPESKGGFASEETIKAHGCLDADDYLPSGGVHCFANCDGYSQQVARYSRYL
jgi:hypothetical protein